MVNIENLNKTFTEGETLEYTELNDLVAKVNELVAKVNELDSNKSNKSDVEASLKLKANDADLKQLAEKVAGYHPGK